MTFVAINKARKPRRTAKRVFHLTNRMAKAVKVDLLRGLETFKRKVDASTLLESWKSGDYSKIMTAVPWDELPSDLEDGFKEVDKAIDASSELTIQSLPPNIQQGLRFDTTNPRIRDYLFKRTGALVVDIQTDVQEIIQNAVARSFNEALTPDQVAGTIRRSIGLYPRQATALRNYEHSLVERGTKPRQLNALVKQYESRLLDQRAMMIARTETRFATNQGQLEVWQQAANEDLIDRGSSKKVWIVDGRPCKICRPMNGKAVGLDENWTLPDGRSVSIPTESHPNCMCSMEIEMV